MSLEDAVSQGRVAGLEALRDRLAREIDGCGSPRDVAALSNRLMDVLEQLDVLAGNAPSRGGQVNALEELRRRHSERRRLSGATG